MPPRFPRNSVHSNVTGDEVLEILTRQPCPAAALAERIRGYVGCHPDELRVAPVAPLDHSRHPGMRASQIPVNVHHAVFRGRAARRLLIQLLCQLENPAAFPFSAPSIARISVRRNCRNPRHPRSSSLPACSLSRHPIDSHAFDPICPLSRSRRPSLAEHLASLPPSPRRSPSPLAPPVDYNGSVTSSSLLGASPPRPPHYHLHRHPPHPPHHNYPPHCHPPYASPPPHCHPLPPDPIDDDACWTEDPRAREYRLRQTNRHRKASAAVAAADTAAAAAAAAAHDAHHAAAAAEATAAAANADAAAAEHARTHAESARRAHHAAAEAAAVAVGAAQRAAAADAAGAIAMSSQRGEHPAAHAARMAAQCSFDADAARASAAAAAAAAAATAAAVAAADRQTAQHASAAAAAAAAAGYGGVAAGLGGAAALPPFGAPGVGGSAGGMQGGRYGGYAQSGPGGTVFPKTNGMWESGGGGGSGMWGRAGGGGGGGAPATAGGPDLMPMGGRGRSASYGAPPPPPPSRPMSQAPFFQSVPQTPQPFGAPPRAPSLPPPRSPIPSSTFHQPPRPLHPPTFSGGGSYRSGSGAPLRPPELTTLTAPYTQPYLGPPPVMARVPTDEQLLPTQPVHPASPLRVPVAPGVDDRNVYEHGHLLVGSFAEMDGRGGVMALEEEGGGAPVDQRSGTRSLRRYHRAPSNYSLLTSPLHSG